jgi:ankyrin repeat protein
MNCILRSALLALALLPCFWFPSHAQDIPPAKDIGSNTPLISALQAKDLDSAKALIAAGADVNARGSGGTTALIQAVQMDCTECVEVLLAAHAAVNAKDGEGITRSCMPLASYTRTAPRRWQALREIWLV